MLTHGNLVSNLFYAADYFGLAPRQIGISFLPLSHVTARHLDCVLFNSGVTVAYCPAFSEVPQYLKEIRPNIFVGVPRIYEKVRDAVLRETASGLKRKIYDWALRIGSFHRDEILAGKRPTSLCWQLANALLYRKIRHALGGRARIFVSGGA